MSDDEPSAAIPGAGDAYNRAKQALREAVATETARRKRNTMIALAVLAGLWWYKRKRR